MAAAVLSASRAPVCHIPSPLTGWRGRSAAMSRSRRGMSADDDDGFSASSSPRHSRHGSTPPDDEQEAADDEPTEEELRRQVELDAAKAELFGPRHKPKLVVNSASPSDTSTPATEEGGEGEEEEELSEDALLNFDLGELDITTVDIPVEFDEVDDDLLQFQSDPLVNEALTKGVDLRLYSLQLGDELNGKEQNVLRQYVEHSDALAVLHAQVKGCDEILRRMEDLVSGFTGSIGGMSDEIAGMQEKSMVMNTKLDNRKITQHKLSKFIRSVYLAPDIVNKLNDGTVDDDYADAVTALDRHLQSVHVGDYSTAKAMEEVLPQIERTKQRTTQRIKQHLTHKFNDVASCRTSAAVKEEQQQLLPLHPLYAFLINQGSDATCEEIRQSYVDSVSKVYVGKFKKYWSDVRRVADMGSMEKGDLLAVQEREKQGLFQKKQTGDGMNRLFQLGEREGVLKSERAREEQVEEIIERDRAAAASAATPSAKGTTMGGGKVPFERLWKYGCDLLLESGINEYDFIVGFFGERENEKEKAEHERKDKEREDSRRSTTQHDDPSSTSSMPSSPSHTSAPSPRSSSTSEVLYERGRQRVSAHSHDKQLFTLLFQKVTQPFHEALDSYLATCNDPLSLLLLIRTATAEQSYLHSLHIYYMDFVFERMCMFCWPKFKHLFDAQLDSIKSVPSLIPDGKRNARETAQMVANVHFIIQRYADFAVSILKLNSGFQQDDVVAQSMKRLSNAIDALISRSTVKLTNGKQQFVYQMIVYSFLLGRLRSVGEENETRLYWQRAYDGQLNVFMEEELLERFRALITFSKQHEMALKDPSMGELPVDWAAVEGIVRHFNKSWREAIEGLSVSIGREFEGSGGLAGAVVEELVRSVLLQLVRYYGVFVDCMKKYGRQKPQLMRDVMPVQNVMSEVRKYAKIQQ